MPGLVRIKGVVRLANFVRRELAGADSRDHVARLRAKVTRELRNLDGLLATYRIGDLDLPKPSQRALSFLRRIDWDQLPTQSIAKAPQARPGETLRFPRMKVFIEAALRQLARPPAENELSALQASFERMSGQIEASIRLHGQGIQLSGATRAGRGWIAFLAQPRNLVACVDTVRRATSLFAPLARDARCSPPVQVHPRPMKGIYRFRSTHAGTVVSLPTPMIAFEDDELLALGRLMFARDRTQRKSVARAMLGERFQTVRAELESLGGVVEHWRGAFHDLGESFNRVNAQFFAGGMPAPRLTWSGSFTGRKFGHYDSVHDTVMVTSSLDRADVPAYVVDYIVYHELLHKKHGRRWKNGRGYAHTSGFYAEERRFPQYHQADAVIDRIARGETP